jgi:hypothetical protein
MYAAAQEDACAGQYGRSRDGREIRSVRHTRRLPRQRFREPEVEHLHRPISAQLDARGFEIAMDDALLMRGSRASAICFAIGNASSIGTAPPAIL